MPHIFFAYLRGWLLIDVLAMVPSAFDIYFASLAPVVDDGEAMLSAAELLLASNVNSSDSVPPVAGVKASRSVRLVKLVRLARMLKILRLLVRWRRLGCALDPTTSLLDTPKNRALTHS